MADPVNDENMILELLRSPIKAETAGRLQSGAVQALIDIYDRKTTREEFLQMAAPCVALYGQVCKLWILQSIQSVFEDGDLDKERFDKAREGLEDVIRVQAESVIEIVKRLQMCPTSQDAVH
jgi:hypothetical protein